MIHCSGLRSGLHAPSSCRRVYFFRPYVSCWNESAQEQTRPRDQQRPLIGSETLVQMAVADIGLAAPEALNFCLSAKQAIEFLRSPEGDPALAERVA
jgi:hypothetical protein